jgi:hypothetical protein
MCLQYTGQIIIGGMDDWKEQYSEHDWAFTFVSPSELDSGTPPTEAKDRLP